MLFVLVAIWARNYRTIRSRQTLGSLLFAGFLLAENVIALYYYLFGPVMPTAAIQTMMVLQILETVGIGALVVVTME